MMHADSAIVAFDPTMATARLRLICVPHAGGGASVFRQWPQLLLGTAEVLTVRLPGRESRISEPLLTSMDQILADLIGPLTEKGGNNPPYVLYGHSFGALVCFELAREMRRRGLVEPTHLFVSGRHAPHQASAQPAIGHLPDEEFLAAIRRLGGMSPEVVKHRSLVDLLLPAMRGDFQASESYRYRPEPPLDCPISAFGGQDDPAAPPAQIEGWSAYTTGRFRRRISPGDHFFVNTHVTSLVDAIRYDLAPTGDAGEAEQP